jgi:hypothetical protein
MESGFHMKLVPLLVLSLCPLSHAFASKAKAPAQLEYLPAQPDRKAAAPAGATPLTKKLADGTLLVDFEGETVGAEPKSFSAAVGHWLVGVDGTNRVLVVDGRKWDKGQTGANIAEKARLIYGERYAEFLDSVKNYAYFPFAVLNDVSDFRNGEISFRFKPIDGRVDQGAGIVFNLKPNGDYLIVRANALENNLILFKYVKGERSSVEWVRNVPTATRQWHDLKVEIQGKEVKGYLDGKHYLSYKLPEPVSGRIGVWSKADSVVYFDDYRVKESGNPAR